MFGLSTSIPLRLLLAGLIGMLCQIFEGFQHGLWRGRRRWQMIADWPIAVLVGCVGYGVLLAIIASK